MKRTVVLAAALVAGITPELCAQPTHENTVIDLWAQGKPAFGVFVPSEAGRTGAAGAGGAASAANATPDGSRPKPLYTKAGGEKLAANLLYDYVFLNLEGSFDPGAVKAIVAGLRSAAATSRKSLIVRVPPFHQDAVAGRNRIRDVFGAGADGITFPHVRSVDEAHQIIGAVRAEKIDVWSTENSQGEKLLMLMIEEPEALAHAVEFANLTGYSILACGIGSLTQALGGNREEAEAGTQKILAETKRVKLVNMLTATTQDVEKRVKEGFLAILAQGQDPDAAIKIGRALAGR